MSPRRPGRAAVVRSIPRACDPTAAFARLYGNDARAFLCESLERSGTRGRYSFFGGRPLLSVQVRGSRTRVERDGQYEQVDGSPLDSLRRVLAELPPPPPLAPFPGGLLGYFAYDFIRAIEEIPDRHAADTDVPEAWLLAPGEVILCDHVADQTHVVVYAEDEIAADRRIAEILAVVEQAAEPSSAPPRIDNEGDLPEARLRSHTSREQYCAQVAQAIEHIRAGDIFQTVLSQRFDFDWRGDALPLYSALRATNPSPYMYYLALDELRVLGSSPEMLVKLEDRRVTTRPLAGTRPRGATAAADAMLEAELRADAKERAEHVMLVDLARNDIGRVCAPGSVRVTELLDVERYSRVMHLVSNVVGELRPDQDAFDLLAATFPAGTVSGAPKVRAMQIIDGLEPCRRGVYAGAIGYISGRGALDLCIAIRTIVLRGGTGQIQAGAGIVADSDPQREYQETLDKSRGLMRAVAMAGRRGHS